MKRTLFWFDDGLCVCVCVCFGCSFSFSLWNQTDNIESHVNIWIFWMFMCFHIILHLITHTIPIHTIPSYAWWQCYHLFDVCSKWKCSFFRPSYFMRGKSVVNRDRLFIQRWYFDTIFFYIFYAKMKRNKCKTNPWNWEKRTESTYISMGSSSSWYRWKTCNERIESRELFFSLLFK